MLSNVRRKSFSNMLEIFNIDLGRRGRKNFFRGPTVLQKVVCRDKKLRVLAQIARTFACTGNFVARHPNVQLSNVLLPTQLQRLLAQIARTFACTDNFVARRPKVLFFCDLLPHPAPCSYN